MALMLPSDLAVWASLNREIWHFFSNLSPLPTARQSTMMEAADQSTEAANRQRVSDNLPAGVSPVWRAYQRGIEREGHTPEALRVFKLITTQPLWGKIIFQTLFIRR